MRPMASDVADLILNRTWRPMLAITGADGLPLTLKAERAAQRVKQLLEADPPYGASVRYEYGQAATGWNAPPTAPWLERTVDEASRRLYGAPAMWMGEGGT